MARTEAGGCPQAPCLLAARRTPRDSLVLVCGHKTHMLGVCPVPALPHPEHVWEEKVPAPAGPGQVSPWIQHFHHLKQATLFVFTLNNYTSTQALLLPQSGRHPTASGICVLCPLRCPGYLKQSLLPSLASHWQSSTARVLTARSWLCQAW